ncbi:MAG: VOC family protein [Blastocatellia bacterium]|nr:VOC family protein [Blastocatellia bacterium]
MGYDIGLTHIALAVKDIDRSIAFYEKYANLKLIHRRMDENLNDVAWISDLVRPFVIVLVKVSSTITPLLAISHLGVACKSREEVDRLIEEARKDNILLEGPIDHTPPVGYIAFISDPDGHTLEISFGQEIGFTVEQAQKY